MQLRDKIRQFVEKEIAPVANDLDRNCTFPSDILKKLAKLGYYGMDIEKQYRGLQLSTIDQCTIIEEISKACPSTACCLAAHSALGTFLLKNNLDNNQKKEILPKIAKGDILTSFSTTELKSGSDLASIQTLAEEKNDHYIINGHKIFATNARYADIIVATTTINPELKHRGIILFFVEKNTKGLSIGKSPEKLGLRATDNCELFFKDMIIPKDNIISKDGFKAVMQGLDVGRILISAQAIGITQAAYDSSKEHAEKRVQFGKSIIEFDDIKNKLNYMETNLKEARRLMKTAAELRDNNKRFTKEAAMAKLFSSELATKATSEAMQIHGGRAYIKGHLIERLFRDAKVTEIYEGTSEILKMVIERE